jgi:HEAT repeat protein
MPKSMSELRQQLSAIEPDEHTYEGIGPSEVDLLSELIDDEEAWLAARAVHALSRIDADEARDAIVTAAGKPRMEVRVAAAASAGALPPKGSDEVLSKLLGDSHASVRKFAIKSVSDRNSDAIRRRIREMATTDPDTGLRHIAEARAKSVSPP